MVFAQASVRGGVADFHVIDETQSFDREFQYAPGSDFESDGTAELIAEREKIGAQLPLLAQSSMEFQNSRVGDFSDSEGDAIPIGQETDITGIDMRSCDNSIHMMDTGGISADGLSFDETWLSYGKEESC